MYTLETPKQVSPLPPCCPNCCEIMSFSTKEEHTLLGHFQLNNYKFECNTCGYSSARIVQEQL